MINAALFHPITTGRITLQHRVVLAPMTRIRADELKLAPTEQTAAYYEQRASAGGLLITEAVHISPEATPIWTIYQRVTEKGGQVPGIWTETQMEAWRAVVARVHAKGGRIICQLLHTGRVAQPEIAQHPLVKGTDAPLPPVSSSATAIEASNETGNQYNWDKGATLPRALPIDEIPRLIADYRHAAFLARRAGFDGVELHAAHGYLIEQFMNDGVNQRSDRYGGRLENRCRLLFDVVAALVDEMGPGRVGVRLSPTHLDPETGHSRQVYFGVRDGDPLALYTHAVEGLNAFPLAYLMLTEPRVGGLSQSPEAEDAYRHPMRNRGYRDLYDGVLIGAGGFTPSTATAAVADGSYDLIAFGRWFLSNPDLPERLRQGADLTVYERETFYGAGAEGYIDYPNLEQGPGRFTTMPQSQIGGSLRCNRPVTT
ncbi:alkene reductase [Rhodobacteraceae bacterium M382]|nr:alkene reductase [Rhodobacteraceae bacterium M382]